jgi:hypothetical protein
MQRFTRFFTALLALCVSATAFADPPKTGLFELSFTQRSPLSDLKTLTRRFKLVAKPGTPLADYDLSQEHYLVYVPASYDPAQPKPLGLIVLANYKHSDEFPKAIVPELDAANVAMIIPKEYLDCWYQRAGVDLDAAFNMQKLYTIDPKRVYVFGGGDWPDKDGTETMVAARIGLTYPEVFTGTFTVGIDSYRKVPNGLTSEYSAEMPHPVSPQFTMDRARPFVWGQEDDAPPEEKLFLQSYKTDGFRYARSFPITKEQFHYPNLQTGWLPGVLKFMDDATATLKLPVNNALTQPSTPPKPAPLTP